MLVADWVPVPIVLPKQIRKLQTLLGSVVVQAEDGNAQFPGDGFQFPVVQVEFRQHQQRGAVTLRTFGELAQRKGGELQLLLRQQTRMPGGGVLVLGEKGSVRGALAQVLRPINCGLPLQGKVKRQPHLDMQPLCKMGSVDEPSTGLRQQRFGR